MTGSDDPNAGMGMGGGGFGGFGGGGPGFGINLDDILNTEVINYNDLSDNEKNIFKNSLNKITDIKILREILNFFINIDKILKIIKIMKIIIILFFTVNRLKIFFLYQSQIKKKDNRKEK